jgi:uncharacterized protein (TIGR00730 family)
MILGIFCGSSDGNDPRFGQTAFDVGRRLAGAGIGVVYGGGRVGLMGAVADGALSAGGRVIGVIPRAMVDRELAHPGLTELRVVETMHERKAEMAEIATGFVALPGGPGTLEEIFEQWTWAQLGIHDKPCGFLDVGGYFRPLRAMSDTMVGAGFMRERHAEMLVFADDIDTIVARFRAYEPPSAKWTVAGETVRP